jgi:hypothetical protein
MKDNINEHDMTKKMMDIIRGGYKSRLITEAEEENQTAEPQTGLSPDAGDQKDTITPKKGDAVFNDEYKKLSEIVDPSVEITNFKIYPVDKNAIIEGNILNNRAQFKLELSEDEAKVDTGTIGLNDDNNEILKKLQGYFKNWKNEWSKKITTEFNQRQD